MMFTRALILGVVFSVASFVAMTSVASANLIVNGSFETGDYNNLDSDSRPEIMLILPGESNIDGWTVTGASGVHWLDTTLGYPAEMPDGIRSLDLQGENAPPFSALSQTFTTTVGTNYVLEFYAMIGSGDSNGATVSVGPLSEYPITGIPYSGDLDLADWTNYSIPFSATSTTSTLLFSVVNSNGFGPVIDNVSVTVVPEPGTMSLLFFGSIAIGSVGAVRRKRSA